MLVGSLAAAAKLFQIPLDDRVTLRESPCRVVIVDGDNGGAIVGTAGPPVSFSIRVLNPTSEFLMFLSAENVAFRK